MRTRHFILSRYLIANIKTAQDSVAIFRRGPEFLPWEIHQVIRCHVDLVWNTKRTTGYTPEVETHSAQGHRKYRGKGKGNLPNHKWRGRAIIAPQPDDERRHYCQSKEQAFKRPCETDQCKAKAHQPGIAYTMVPDNPGKCANHQRAAQRCNRSAPIAVRPIAERPDTYDR